VIALTKVENRLSSLVSWWFLKAYLRVISGKTRGWDRLIYRLDRDEKRQYRVWLQVIRGQSMVKHLAATSRSPGQLLTVINAVLTTHLPSS